MEIVEETGLNNEIEQFQDARYVSASETARKIFACDIIDNDPPVVHTEGHHTVFFRENEELPAALREPQTKLTEWEKANTIHPGDSHLRYDKFLPFVAWNRKDKVWKCSEGEELEELAHHLQAPLYLQSIIWKALERPS